MRHTGSHQVDGGRGVPADTVCASSADQAPFAGASRGAMPGKAVADVIAIVIASNSRRALIMQSFQHVTHRSDEFLELCFGDDERGASAIVSPVWRTSTHGGSIPGTPPVRARRVRRRAREFDGADQPTLRTSTTCRCPRSA